MTKKRSSLHSIEGNVSTDMKANGPTTGVNVIEKNKLLTNNDMNNISDVITSLQDHKIADCDEKENEVFDSPYKSDDGVSLSDSKRKKKKKHHSSEKKRSNLHHSKSMTQVSDDEMTTVSFNQYLTVDIYDADSEETQGFLPESSSQILNARKSSHTFTLARPAPTSKEQDQIYATECQEGAPGSGLCKHRWKYRTSTTKVTKTTQKSALRDFHEKASGSDGLFSWMSHSHSGSFGSYHGAASSAEKIGPALFLPKHQDLCEDKRVYNPDPDAENPRAVILDVGGKRHKVLESNFNIYPNTRLGKLVRAKTEEEILSLCDGYLDGEVPEFFFDRNWHCFNSILDIYRTGVLHLNTDMCALVLQKDLEYWQIDELILEPCCALKYYPEIEICVKEQKGEEESKRKENQRLEDENFGTHRIGRIRTYLWNLMEYPETSIHAQAMAFTSLSVVIISTMTFILGTFPEFQSEEESGHEPEYKEAVFAMEIIDNITVAFFLVEYVIRFACSPRKLQFFVGPMNLVDLFAIVPFFLDLIIGGLQDFQIMGKAGKIVRLVRVMRIMRIFKLVRHFAGLQSLIYTLNQAYKELGLLMLLVGVAVLTFSSLVYFAEKDNPLGPWSFLDSFWWGLMTLTTVGYGDLSPSTFPGKLIGGLCALGGVFILTLPIPIVVNSFASYYKNRLWRNEVAYKKRQRAKKRKEMELLMRDNLLNILTVPGAPIPRPVYSNGEKGM